MKQKQQIFTTTAARKRWFILLQLAAQGEEVIIVERDRNQQFKLVLVGKPQRKRKGEPIWQLPPFSKGEHPN
jgi:hypothetical protein